MLPCMPFGLVENLKMMQPNNICSGWNNVVYSLTSHNDLSDRNSSEDSH